MGAGAKKPGVPPLSKLHLEKVAMAISLFSGKGEGGKKKKGEDGDEEVLKSLDN